LRSSFAFSLLELLIDLPIYPLVEISFAKPPETAKFESWDRSFGGVLIQGVLCYTEIVRRLVNVHDFSGFPLIHILLRYMMLCWEVDTSGGAAGSKKLTPANLL